MSSRSHQNGCHSIHSIHAHSQLGSEDTWRIQQIDGWSGTKTICEKRKRHSEAIKQHLLLAAFMEFNQIHTSTNRSFSHSSSTSISFRLFIYLFVWVRAEWIQFQFEICNATCWYLGNSIPRVMWRNDAIAYISMCLSSLCLSVCRQTLLEIPAPCYLYVN